MATTQEKQERIEVFARKLAEEFGEVDDSNALSWLDAVALQDGAHVPEPSCLLLIGYAILVRQLADAQFVSRQRQRQFHRFGHELLRRRPDPRFQSRHHVLWR